MISGGGWLISSGGWLLMLDWRLFFIFLLLRLVSSGIEFDVRVQIVIILVWVFHLKYFLYFLNIIAIVSFLNRLDNKTLIEILLNKV